MKEGDGELRIENMVYINILLSLLNRPSHGYEILKNAEETLGHRLSASHVYPFLRRLKNKGYVEIVEKGPRKKKAYRLTPEGRKFVRRMLGKFSNLLELFLSSKIKVCYHCGSKIIEGGIKKGNRHFCCEHCYHHYKKGE